MKPSEAALYARDIPWTQGQIWRDAASVPVRLCQADQASLFGQRALAQEHLSDFYDWAVFHRTTQQVAQRQIGTSDAVSIGHWNDAPDRTESDIRDFWDEVARDLKEQGL